MTLESAIKTSIEFEIKTYTEMPKAESPTRWANGFSKLWRTMSNGMWNTFRADFRNGKKRAKSRSKNSTPQSHREKLSPKK